MFLRRETGLEPGHLADRGAEVALGVAAVEDAGLVEMHVRLDEARRQQLAAEIERLGLGRKARRQRDDPAARDADVDQPIGIGRETRVAQDQVHLTRSSRR